MSTKKRKDTFVFYSEWVDITDESGIDDTISERYTCAGAV